MTRRIIDLGLLLLTGTIAACSAGDDGTHELGSVELALAETPEDARCLEVSFSGSVNASKRFDLTPGSPAQFRMSRLNVGLTNVDARAYPTACALVSASTEPSFVLESPLTVRIRPAGVTPLLLRLVRNGRVAIDVDFADSDEGSRPLQLAVIGDTPYGAQQLETFGALVTAINGAGVSRAIHVGDIKNGSTRCDDSYFARIADYFADFTVPLVYTPGDNEWTDCHRANNGAYDPIERLNALRDVFFSEPGQTLGKPIQLLSQASVADHSAFVENTMWYESSVVFSTVHAVGSSNGLAPWFGTDTTGTKQDDPARRTAEVQAREAAALDWIDRSFALAAAEHAKAVAIFMQADTFEGSTTGFERIVERLADRARAFAKPVLLVQGDSHTYLVDQPLLDGNAGYGITESVPNLTRVVVQGETASEWLELTVDPNATEVFSWQRRSLTTPPPPPAAGSLRINEISSNPNPDWVEFVNPTNNAADVSGWYITDNAPTDAGHVYTFPAGTVVGPGALLIRNQDVHFSFGLGSADSLVLHDQTGAIVDQHSWSAHVTSVGRCGTSSNFVAMSPTPNAANTCP